MTTRELNDRIRYMVCTSIQDGIHGVNNCYCPVTLRHALDYEHSKLKRKTMIAAIERRLKVISN